MKRIAKSLAQGLKAAMHGLENAHLGDLLSREAKDAALAVAGPENSLAIPAPRVSAGPAESIRARRVVLAVGESAKSDAGSDAARYAIEVCERLDADLVVIAKKSDADAALRNIVESARPPGRTPTFIECGSDFLCCIRRYVAAHADVLFVVTSAADALAGERSSRAASLPVRQANVPWVVVAGGDDGISRQLPADAA